MNDPSTHVAAILAALRTVPGVTVYDGFVPASVPTTGSYIKPYIVLWAGTGDDPGELAACGTWGGDTLILDFQTTAVGASPEVCRSLATATTAKLANLPVGTGKVRRNPDGFNQAAPILDTQTSPARLLLPQQWRLITN